MAIAAWFGGEEKELLPKDVLVDLEKNPNRADEMLERIIKDERIASDFDGATFVTATAMAPIGVSQLEIAMRQAELAAQMQNQQIGGLFNGLGNQSSGTALGGLGGLLGPRR